VDQPPYSIPGIPSRWRGHPTDSINEAEMLCDLERRGLTSITPHPPPFFSARWGRWSPDAVGPVPTSSGLLQVYWDFKYNGWLQGGGHGDLPSRMMAAYEEPRPCWAVIAQQDEFLRLVTFEAEGVSLRKVIWHRSGDKWGLIRVHRDR